MLRLALIGPGRMGRAVAAAAAEQGHAVVAVLGCDTPVSPTTLAGADVAVEFTTATAAPENVRRCVDAGCPVVVGTTGWSAEVPAVEAYVREHGGAMLAAANFSLGVLVLSRLVAEAGRLAALLPDASAHLLEMHHAAKRDAPSGTALALADAWRSAATTPLPVTSVRLGHVPGTHELVLDGRYEQVVLRHEARDRRVFAEGALAAARWLAGRTGIFTLSDLLEEGHSHD